MTVTQDIRQTTSNIDELFAQAERSKPVLDKLTNEIAAKFGATAIIRGDLKQRKRAEEKTVHDYSGDGARLLDIARTALVADSLEALDEIVKAIGEKVEIVREKNRFDLPMASGYRDRVLNLRLPDGHIVEMQLHLTDLYNVKKASHANYKTVRALAEQLDERDGAGEYVIRGRDRARKMDNMNEALLTIAFVNKSAVDRYNERRQGRRLPYAATERAIARLMKSSHIRNPHNTWQIFRDLIGAVHADDAPDSDYRNPPKITPRKPGA